MASFTSVKLTPAQEQEVHERVSFDIVLRQLKGNHTSFSEIKFAGVPLGTRMEWVGELCEALAANTTVLKLDLSNTQLSDPALQKLVVTMASSSCTPQLECLDLRSNPFSLAGETMAQGLRKLRPKLSILLGDASAAGLSEVDGFVHDKAIVEGLSAWGAETLKMEDGGMRCPAEVSGPGPAVKMEKGFSGANGTKYTCEYGEFELTHVTGCMVLKKLSPEAALRLSCKTSSGRIFSHEAGNGTLV